MSISQARARRSAVGLAALAALFLLVVATTSAFSQTPATRIEQVRLHTAGGIHSIRAEIAADAAARSVGLMYRQSLAPDAGMLFLYGEPTEISMWMRNTLIPLDMIFIREDGIVHRIEKMTTPLSERTIDAGIPVIACLEIAGGRADEIGLRPGDRVEHAAFPPP